MTLLITVFAAVISTVIWYCSTSKDSMKISVLCFMYWGASIMWFVDAVAEYIKLHEAYFTPSLEDMINDTYLGLSVVTLGLVIWVIVLLIKDPKKKLQKTLFHKQED